MSEFKVWDIVKWIHNDVMWDIMKIEEITPEWWLYLSCLNIWERRKSHLDLWDDLILRRKTNRETSIVLFNEYYLDTYIEVTNKQEYDKALEFYKSKWYETSKCTTWHYTWTYYVDWFNEWFFWLHSSSPVNWTINITQWVLWKKTERLLENKITSGESMTVSMYDWVYNTDTICGTQDYVTQDQLDKTLLTFNQKKMQTIQEKLFEKFLNKNEKKILDAVEVSQENTERFSNLQTKLSSIVCDYSTTRARLTDGYNTADQKKIEEQLAKLDKFNKLFGDDMFNQLSVIRDKIEKSMDKFIN